MKKLIAVFLAAALLASLTACGGAEPAETTAATTEAIVVETEAAPTEAPTEESTEAPTEPRVAPTNFEPVDPTSLPEPIPVEEQLLSEDTHTVTLGSLEEYEDLLWSLGFEEVRLTGSHQALVQVDTSKYTSAISYCEPVSLTYNDKAFRFDFIYCQQLLDGTMRQEAGWSMYGTKSNSLENVSAVMGADYYESEIPFQNTITLGDGQSIDAFLGSFDWSSIGATNSGSIVVGGSTANGNTEANGTATGENTNYEEEFMRFGSHKEADLHVYLKAVYYPITGNLYNYMADPTSGGQAVGRITLDQNGNYLYQTTSFQIGYGSQKMCFHYLFPAEDAAE